MQARVKKKNFDQLNEWLNFNEWVLSHPDWDHRSGYRRDDKSKENPDWTMTRRAVGDFIGVCLENDVDVPLTARGQLAKFLETLCTQFDWRLDEDKPIILNRYDLYFEGINNTRSRALLDLVKFGFWVRRHDPECKIPEVAMILEKRFAPGAECPLTLPEYAILGRGYYYIFSLDVAWATKHKSNFFPQKVLPAWLAAFESFIVHNSSSKPIFEVLQDDFHFALQHLSNFKKRDRLGKEPIDILGQRLFTYYLWELYPLRGEESLIERFYEQTDGKREHWTNLFNHVGSCLRNSEGQLDRDLKNRVITFFEWRFKQKDPIELQRFTSWLEAECLEAEWRLEMYSKILDLCEIDGRPVRLQALCDMLPNHTAEVVKCFSKLSGKTIYMLAEEARAILKAGRASNDDNVRHMAERSLDNLLKSGRFVLTDLDD